MKKLFKPLAIVLATAAIGGSVAAFAGCSGGYNGEYTGDYHYTNSYGAEYGMKVRVTVKNNIITKVEDITKGAYTVVSPGWVDKYVADYNAASEADKNNTYKFPVKPEVGDWGLTNAAAIEAIAPDYYGWSNASAANWTDNESWLLQKYEGWAVADVLAIHVSIKETGEPYSAEKNEGLGELMISGSTQGSGRLLLAIQDAFGQPADIGRIETADKK